MAWAISLVHCKNSPFPSFGGVPPTGGGVVLPQQSSRRITPAFGHPSNGGECRFPLPYSISIRCAKSHKMKEKSIAQFGVILFFFTGLGFIGFENCAEKKDSILALCQNAVFSACTGGSFFTDYPHSQKTNRDSANDAEPYPHILYRGVPTPHRGRC